jgi:hypothetical protein
MKTLLSLIVLVAIISIYIISANFYVQGNLVIAYTLILSSLTSFVFWIKFIDLSKILIKA